MEQAKSFYYFCVLQNYDYFYTGFPCPYIGHVRLRLCVNLFLSLTPSHYDLARYFFTLGLPFFPLRVTPRLFKHGLSAPLRPFMLGRRRRPTTTTFTGFPYLI